MNSEERKEELLRNKRETDKQKQQFAAYVKNQQEGQPENQMNQEIEDSQRTADEQNRMKDTENQRR
ncbi:hypothetical protein [Aneurinibacillus sp. REN35]|uniref:hypothetical protein n=1 Tax=Aneurinibacillus sp. REN35 TaxID=3237286 RepID=UPI0035299458